MIGPIPSRFTAHATQKLRDLDATSQEIDWALRATPYQSRNWPDQWRFCAGRLCLIVADGTGVIITAYLNRAVTPLRPDQIAAGVQIKRSAR